MVELARQSIRLAGPDVAVEAPVAHVRDATRATLQILIERASVVANEPLDVLVVVVELVQPGHIRRCAANEHPVQLVVRGGQLFDFAP
jgi:propanediol dehydratase small subunit